MIRSAEHVAFEAAMWRGARDAELRWIAAIAEISRPFTEAMRAIGIGLQEAVKPLAAACKALEKACISLDLERRGR